MFSIYEYDGGKDILIGTATDFNQACRAAWSRASRNKSNTWVTDSEQVVEQYDYGILYAKTMMIETDELDFDMS